jgi:hypothetical protein
MDGGEKYYHPEIKSIPRNCNSNSKRKLKGREINSRRNDEKARQNKEILPLL